MEFQIDASMLIYIPLIVGITEGVKKAVPILATKNWVIMGLSAALGLSTGLVYGPGNLQSDVLTGVVLALAANGLYDYAKPVGLTLPPADKPK
jgi:hypothetical protein